MGRNRTAGLEAHNAGDVALVAASSPLAQSVEIREARRTGNVTQLQKSQRPVISAGKRLGMKPGRSHLLLVGPLRPIKKGERVPITLEFETKDARRFTVEVTAEAMASRSKKHWHEEPHQH